VVPARPWTAIVTRTAAGLRQPLNRNALALAVNTGVTSLLGVLYWVLAAHFYPPAVVGASSALIAMFVFLANVAELNLCNALTRFLPVTGARTRRFLISAYAAVAVTGVIVGVAALPFVRHLPMMDRLLGLGPLGVLWFLAAVVVWCLFALQDYAVTGLRAAVWVPLENALFGLAKVALVVVLAGVWPLFGIFASWTIPMLLTLAPMNLLIFTRLIPRHERDPSARTEVVSIAEVRGFVTFDYAAGLAATAVSALVPIIVAARAGVEANAYFYVAWVMRGAFDVALTGAAMSLTVEGARRQERLGALTRALTRRVVVLAVPLIAVLLVAAPVILAIYGPSYAAHSTTLLRLLALSMLPRIVIVIWISVMRVRRTLGRILAVESVLSILVVGLSAALVDRYGIVSLGVIQLLCQTAVAAALLPSFLALLRGSESIQEAVEA
jgi:O-antigen/teichoic acid export membrane protein